MVTEKIGPFTIKDTSNSTYGEINSRWFDKSFSLIFTKDGVGGVNFEHSWGDGVAVLRYFQDIYKESIDNPHVHPATKPSDDVSGNVQKLSMIKSNFVLKYIYDDFCRYPL